MKDQPNRKRLPFAVSFFGAAFIGGLTLYAGNTWLTVYERAAVSFIVLWLVAYFAGSAFQSILAQEEKTTLSSFDQTLPPEVPVFSNGPENSPQAEDFTPWTFPASPPHQAEFHERETER
ncbi:MAG: hypothetical protein JWN30_950 [Bacilli bacterium]|nr:hypothetical protein [Bacilli bacterium]